MSIGRRAQFGRMARLDPGAQTVQEESLQALVAEAPDHGGL